MLLGDRSQEFRVLESLVSEVGGAGRIPASSLQLCGQSRIERLIDYQDGHACCLCGLVVLKYLIVPTHRVLNLRPPEFVVLAKRTQARESTPRQLGDLRGGYTTIADCWTTAESIRIYLNMLDAGLITNCPTASAKQAGDVLQQRVFEDGLPPMTVTYVKIGIFETKDDSSATFAAGIGCGCQRSRGQGPVAVLGTSVLDSAPNVAMRHATFKQLVDDHRLGHVLEAVDTWATVRVRRSNIPSPGPLTDAVSRDTNELADLMGEVPAAGRRKRVSGHGFVTLPNSRALMETHGRVCPASDNPDTAPLVEGPVIRLVPSQA